MGEHLSSEGKGLYQLLIHKQDQSLCRLYPHFKDETLHEHVMHIEDYHADEWLVDVYGDLNEQLRDNDGEFSTIKLFEDAFGIYELRRAGQYSLWYLHGQGVYVYVVRMSQFVNSTDVYLYYKFLRRLTCPSTLMSFSSDILNYLNLTVSNFLRWINTRR